MVLAWALPKAPAFSYCCVKDGCSFPSLPLVELVHLLTLFYPCSWFMGWFLVFHIPLTPRPRLRASLPSLAPCSLMWGHRCLASLSLLLFVCWCCVLPWCSCYKPQDACLFAVTSQVSFKKGKHLLGFPILTICGGLHSLPGSVSMWCLFSSVRASFYNFVSLMAAADNSCSICLYEKDFFFPPLCLRNYSSEHRIPGCHVFSPLYPGLSFYCLF